MEVGYIEWSDNEKLHLRGRNKFKNDLLNMRVAMYNQELGKGSYVFYLVFDFGHVEEPKKSNYERSLILTNQRNEANRILAKTEGRHKLKLMKNGSFRLKEDDLRTLKLLSDIRYKNNSWFIPYLEDLIDEGYIRI